MSVCFDGWLPEQKYVIKQNIRLRKHSFWNLLVTLNLYNFKTLTWKHFHNIVAGTLQPIETTHKLRFAFRKTCNYLKFVRFTKNKKNRIQYMQKANHFQCTVHISDPDDTLAHQKQSLVDHTIYFLLNKKLKTEILSQKWKNWSNKIGNISHLLGCYNFFV